LNIKLTKPNNDNERRYCDEENLVYAEVSAKERAVEISVL
jgi:hypothetical protein